MRGAAGAIVVAVVLGALYAGGRAWTILVSVLSILSLSEFYGMVSRKFKVSKGVGFIAAILILFTASDGIHPISFVLTLSIASFAILFLEIARRGSGEKATPYGIWGERWRAFYISSFPGPS